MPGEPLFQSDLQHREYVQLTISTASRHRDLKQDWVHAGRVVAEISMSMAQFASMITSGGTEGVPVTISYADGKPVPGLYPDPRLRHTAAEVARAADEAFAKIKTAEAAYEAALSAKPPVPAAERKARLSALRFAISNAAPNVNFAADRLTEHAEAVVERSRADVEAMVRLAQQRGERVLEQEVPDSGPAAIGFSGGSFKPETPGSA